MRWRARHGGPTWVLHTPSLCFLLPCCPPREGEGDELHDPQAKLQRLQEFLGSVRPVLSSARAGQAAQAPASASAYAESDYDAAPYPVPEIRRVASGCIGASGKAGGAERRLDPERWCQRGIQEIVRQGFRARKGSGLSHRGEPTPSKMSDPALGGNCSPSPQGREETVTPSRVFSAETENPSGSGFFLRSGFLKRGFSMCFMSWLVSQYLVLLRLGCCDEQTHLHNRQHSRMLAFGLVGSSFIQVLFSH